MGARAHEALINLHLLRVCVLTTDEFEKLQREVVAHAVADPESLMARICAGLCIDNQYRFHEAKRINAGKVT